MACMKVRNHGCYLYRVGHDSKESRLKLKLNFVLVLFCAASLSACKQSDCDPQTAEQLGFQAASEDQLMDGHPGLAALGCEAAKDSWRKGWRHGVKTLCDPKTGWEMALKGEAGYQVCATEVNQPGSYLASFRLSKQIHELEAEAKLLEEKSKSEALSPQESSRVRNIGYEVNELKVIAEQWGLLEPAGQNTTQPQSDE